MHYWESVYIWWRWWSHSSMHTSRQQKLANLAHWLIPGRALSWEQKWHVAGRSSRSTTLQISRLIQRYRERHHKHKQTLCGKTSMTQWSHQSLPIDQDNLTFNYNVDKKKRSSNKTTQRQWRLINRNKRLSEALSWIKSQQISFHRFFKPHKNWQKWRN